MLSNHAAIATVAVRNLDAGKHFYSDVLGLHVKDGDNSQAITYVTGGAVLLVYASQFAGSNKATAVNWSVGKDFDQIVADIKAKGVTFEHYDMPQVQRDGDIHSAMGMRMVWFKDPDGNIHSIMDTPSV